LTKNKQILNILSIVVLSAILFVACSKERIQGPIDAGTVDEPEKPQIEIDSLYFVPLDSFYNAKKTNRLEIFKDVWYPYPTTYHGTYITGSTYLLIYPNGDNVTRPVDLYTKEYCTIKDFIFNNYKTICNNKLLLTDEIISINYYKGSTLLEYDNTSEAPITLSIISENENYSNIERLFSFYKENNLWILPEDTINNNIFHISNFVNLIGYLRKTGWFLIGDYAQFNTIEYTNLTFTSSNADLTNVGIYVCFSDINSYTKVEDYTSIPLPVGEPAKILAIGITNENELYYNYKEIVIDNNKTEYNIDMHHTTDQVLTQILDSL